jgi:hypothetical protein
MTGNLTDYSGRVTSEHKNKPKFMASLVAAIQPLVDMQYLCNNMYSYFDIDEAVGAQLDVVGEWLNISRQLAVPLPDVFFSWDTLGLGWDHGVWLGPYDPTTGQAQMDDGTYRAVLKMRAALNGWNGTRVGLGELVTETFETLFPGLTMNLLDNYNMSITFQLYGNVTFDKFGAGGLTPIIQQLFLQGLLTVKPSTIAINYELWNGTSFGTSPFQYGIALDTPATVSGLPISSIAMMGSILPVGNAQTVRLQVGTSNVNPPTGMDNPSAGSGDPPPSAGAYWYNPTTYNNTAGTFSTSLPVDITTAGTYYIWAYDPATGLLQCSNAIIAS